MTFAEIVSTVMTRLNLTAPEAQTRVGVYVNERYKMATSSIGLLTSRRTTYDITVNPANLVLFPSLPELTLNGIEKVMSIKTTGAGDAPQGIEQLRELTYEELTSRSPFDRTPQNWAVKLMGPGMVTIVLDGTPSTTYPLTIEGYVIAPTLSGSAVPFLPTDFHDILIEGAKADELWKMEKPVLAQIAEQRYEARLSDLRMFIAKSSWKDIVQGKDKPGQTWYTPWFSRLTV